MTVPFHPFEHFPYARHCVRWFTCSISFSPNNIMKLVLLLFPTGVIKSLT